jgi:hypothetical protein
MFAGQESRQLFRRFLPIVSQRRGRLLAAPIDAKIKHAAVLLGGGLELESVKVGT